MVYITALKPEDEDPIVQSLQSKLPTLQQVSEEITSRGGTCVPIYCDHSDYKQVAALFERISFEQKGRLDILVNNAFAAVTVRTSPVAYSVCLDYADEDAHEVLRVAGGHL